MEKASKNRLVKIIAIIIGIAIIITSTATIVIHAKIEEERKQKESFEYGITYGRVTSIITIMKDLNKISLDDYYNFNVARTRCEMELSKKTIDELNDVVYNLVGEAATEIPFSDDTNKDMFWLGSSVELAQIKIDMAFSYKKISESTYEKMLAKYNKINENPTVKAAIAYIRECARLIDELDEPITEAGNGQLAIPANFNVTIFLIKLY